MRLALYEKIEDLPDNFRTVEQRCIKKALKLIRENGYNDYDNVFKNWNYKRI